MRPTKKDKKPPDGTSKTAFGRLLERALSIDAQLEDAERDAKAMKETSPMAACEVSFWTHELRARLDSLDERSAADARSFAWLGFQVGRQLELLHAQPDVGREERRKKAQKESQDLRTAMRHAAIMAAWKSLPPADRKKKDAAYRKIAAQSKGTPWQCSHGTVRRVISENCASLNSAQKTSAHH